MTADIIRTIAQAQNHAQQFRPKVGGFPYLAEALRQAGVVRYVFEVPSMSVLYVTKRGSVVQPSSGRPRSSGRSTARSAGCGVA
jgi:uncharacterized protein YbcV (DUF1398 family)